MLGFPDNPILIQIRLRLKKIDFLRRLRPLPPPANETIFHHGINRLHGGYTGALKSDHDVMDRGRNSPDYLPYQLPVLGGYLPRIPADDPVDDKVDAQPTNANRMASVLVHPRGGIHGAPAVPTQPIFPFRKVQYRLPDMMALQAFNPAFRKFTIPLLRQRIRTTGKRTIHGSDDAPGILVSAGRYFYDMGNCAGRT